MGLGDRVHLKGWMPQEEVAAELQRSQAFVFPSLLKFDSRFVLDAMTSGLRSLILNDGVPTELVTENTRFALPLQRENGLIQRICHAMEAMANDHEMFRQMADAALHSTYLVCEGSEDGGYLRDADKN